MVLKLSILSCVFVCKQNECPETFPVDPISKLWYLIVDFICITIQSVANKFGGWMAGRMDGSMYGNNGLQCYFFGEISAIWRL